MGVLNDAAAERAVLAGICRYGSDIYMDICDMVKVSTFSIDSNKMLYSCIVHVLKDVDKINKIDLPSILSASNELGYDTTLQRKEEARHLHSILQLPVEQENVRKFATKIRKLEIARLIHSQLGLAQDKISEVKGSENIAEIISIAEDTVFDFTSLLDGEENTPTPLGQGLEQYIQYLEENPVDQLGLSTGFPNWDAAIGGGLRKATLNVIGARPKVGKTLLSDNMGYNLTKEYTIPVLNLDTEMTKEDHQHRSLAMISEVSINDIETGNFASSPDKRNRVYNAVKDIENSKYFHKSIAGKAFEDILSLMRRWIQTEVGFNKDGTAKDCVIIYDYLKLMDAQGISSDMKEYQLLGFMMTTLHNFAVRYKVPFIVFIQLNRDGITKESTDAASGSDRIIWLCSCFSILKLKSDEEIAQDGPANGNRKLVVLSSRHGAGSDNNNYINVHMKGWCGKLTEGQTKQQLTQHGDSKEGFEHNSNDDRIPFH